MQVNLYYLTLLLIFFITIDYRIFGSGSGLPGITLLEILAYSFAFLIVFRKIQVKALPFYDLRAAYCKNRVLFWYFGYTFLAAIAGLLFRSSTETFWLFRDLLPSLIVYI